MKIQAFYKHISKVGKSDMIFFLFMFGMPVNKNYPVQKQ